MAPIQPPVTRTIEALSDAQLLKLRFCDLAFLKAGITANLRPLVRQLHEELSAAGLKHLRPHVYLGDEWFSPSGLASISVPFYLAHRRLARLERTMMATVEGGTRARALQLLRHEAGHCFDHAYGIAKTPGWRRVFAAAASARHRPEGYRPEVYHPDRRSRDFVRHLPGLYAQAHPDEDFAETFAVVITPGLDWRRRYRSWPGASAKLAYMDQLIRHLGPKLPRREGPGEELECHGAARMRMTLARYYEKRRAEAASHAAAAQRLRSRQSLPGTGQGWRLSGGARGT